MSIAASKVKKVCNSTETALVRNSRKPNLEQLSHSQLKQHSARARKLFDKWQGLSRDQSRARGRKVDAGGEEINTQLKAQIFREALDNFEARLAKLDGATTASGGTSKTKKPKRARSAGHRAGRAEVRAELKQTRLKKNKSRSTVKTPSQPPAEPVTEVEAAPAKPKRTTKPSAKTPRVPGSAGISQTRQRKAVTTAKKSRVAKSGLTTRVRGHVSARGKRKQARRDSMN